MTDQLEGYLRYFDAWRGPGCAMVVDTDLLAGHTSETGRSEFHAGLGILIHETAHHVCSRHEKMFTHSRDHLARILADQRANAHRISGMHGAQFVRAALHLWPRTKAAFPVDIDALFVAGERYGMSPAEHYRMTLDNELRLKSNQPVRHVLATKPPEMFNELWLEDCKAKRKCA